MLQFENVNKDHDTEIPLNEITDLIVANKLLCATLMTLNCNYLPPIWRHIKIYGTFKLKINYSPVIP